MIPLNYSSLMLRKVWYDKDDKYIFYILLYKTNCSNPFVEQKFDQFNQFLLGSYLIGVKQLISSSKGNTILGFFESLISFGKFVSSYGKFIISYVKRLL
jgi:hypothetical protein